jgi:hypothetical protein
VIPTPASPAVVGKKEPNEPALPARADDLSATTRQKLFSETWHTSTAGEQFTARSIVWGRS